MKELHILFDFATRCSVDFVTGLLSVLFGQRGSEAPRCADDQDGWHFVMLSSLWLDKIVARTELKEK